MNSKENTEMSSHGPHQLALRRRSVNVLDGATKVLMMRAASESAGVSGTGTGADAGGSGAAAMVLPPVRRCEGILDGDRSSDLSAAAQVHYGSFGAPGWVNSGDARMSECRTSRRRPFSRSFWNWLRRSGWAARQNESRVLWDAGRWLCASACLRCSLRLTYWWRVHSTCSAGRGSHFTRCCPPPLHGCCCMLLRPIPSSAATGAIGSFFCCWVLLSTCAGLSLRGPSDCEP